MLAAETRLYHNGMAFCGLSDGICGIHKTQTWYSLRLIDVLVVHRAFTKKEMGSLYLKCIQLGQSC
jgi:hypothetical protein